jgi:hypothetical protein
MDNPDTRHEWVSVKAAAIHFGTSESDIRRRIKRGELTSESLSRPGGTLLRVRLPAPDTHQPIEEPPAPDTRQDIATGLLERLTAQDAVLGEQRAELARINAENADLRERVGRAEEREASTLDALESVTVERNVLADELRKLRDWRWWNPRTW